MSWIHWLLLILYIISTISISVVVGISVCELWDDAIEGFDEALKSLDRAKRGE